eukprot:scaffold101781_cov20-Tisochrysis_lutea.AAC.5
MLQRTPQRQRCRSMLAGQRTRVYAQQREGVRKVLGRAAVVTCAAAAAAHVQQRAHKHGGAVRVDVDELRVLLKCRKDIQKGHVLWCR